MPFAMRWPAGAASAPVPRRALTLVRLPMPALGRSQLRDAVRLQLTQYMPAGPFGFVCRAQAGGNVLVWAWPLDPGQRSPQRGGSWPETTFDEPGQGLRLLRRSGGFEAQQWSDGELRHSRWFDALPDAAQWQGFVRGCGADPQLHPLAEPVALRSQPRPARAWLAGDNLPAANPWQGWHWQAAVLLVGSAAAAGLGIHLQTRQQLDIDTLRLSALRSDREASLQARRGYEQAAGELQALRALVPRLTQLELLDRITASGIFEPVQPSGAAPTTATPVTKPVAKPGPAVPPAAAPAAPAPTPAAVRLLDWDYRNGQLKLTLDVPEREVALLDITRRLENVPGLSGLRVGQDSSGNTISLSARVTELSAPADAAAAGAPSPAR